MTVDRTVRNGAVRIGGRTYRPSEQHTPYDGRLDGLRYAFGVYQGQPGFVSLHSVAGSTNSDDDNAVMEGPHCVDGYYPWLWWDAEGTSELAALERAASVAATAAASEGVGR